MRKLFLFGVIFFLSSIPAYAECKGNMINPITDVRWSCMLPISLGGVSFSSLPLPEAASAMVADKVSGSVSPLCVCMDPLPRPGVTFSMNIAFRLAEATKDPMCFPSLGMPLGAGPWSTGGQDTGEKKTSQTTFNYTHLISFVPTAALSLMVDVLCLQLSEYPFSVLYISEFMPQSKDAELALLLAPESILFANPIAQAYCMVDAVLTVFEQTDPFGYWCVGGHSIFPLSNHSTEVDYVDASSINIAKMLFTQSRLGQLPSCFGSQALCACVPTAIWNKREFRFQMAKPVTDIFCRRMGKPSLMWNTPNKNPVLTKGEDNLAFLIWRRRDCCVL